MELVVVTTDCDKQKVNNGNESRCACDVLSACTSDKLLTVITYTLHVSQPYSPIV